LNHTHGSNRINTHTNPDQYPIISDDSLRRKVAEACTRVIEGHIYDKATGEYYGTYTSTPYISDPINYTADTPVRTGEDWRPEHDSTVSPLAPFNDSHDSIELAPALELLPKKTMVEARPSSTRGPKPRVMHNLLAPALCILKFEERQTPWLDDIVFGAIHTGPGVISGKHSVSISDVHKVLRLPTISTDAAADCLSNHELRPMSTRQLQRVIEAARIALQGIALHLERHPLILQSIDVQVDFNALWLPQRPTTASAANNEHPKKQRALMMIKANVPIKTIANELDISKNTVKQWKKALIAGDGEGSVEDN